MAEHKRPFICVFHFAGCKLTFATKNEWKRHVFSQHLRLHYWLCTKGQCDSTDPLRTHSRKASSSSIFNRKDLWVSHYRRMHMGPGGTERLSPEKQKILDTSHDIAYKKRCDLPTYMTCPALHCETKFEGSDAWDDHLEHVAGHLGRAAAGNEPPITFGGDHDTTLTRWATSVGAVARGPRGWQMRNPFKDRTLGLGTGRVAVDREIEGKAGSPTP